MIREGRDFMRNVKVYFVICEIYFWVEDDGVCEVCEWLVNVIMVDEVEYGVEKVIEEEDDDDNRIVEI